MAYSGGYRTGFQDEVEAPVPAGGGALLLAPPRRRPRRHEQTSTTSRWRLAIVGSGVTASRAAPVRVTVDTSYRDHRAEILEGLWVLGLVDDDALLELDRAWWEQRPQ